jgi:excisionase family DNA binding protein
MDDRVAIEPGPTATAAPAVYTIGDLARLTQTSERHIHRQIDAGKIPGRVPNLGRAVRFSRKVVDVWLAGES